MAEILRLFLCGDVMTGRGIDQVMPDSNDPALYEPYVQHANQYVDLAEQANGEIPDTVGYEYIWGDALKYFDEMQPDLKLINLETAVTTSDTYLEGKGIHYRMHPENVRVLTEAGIDFCSLANNHVLDWNHAGLEETLHTLSDNGIAYTGAGRNLTQAKRPHKYEIQKGNQIFSFAAGGQSSGIPLSWQATDDSPGVWVLKKLSTYEIDQVVKFIRSMTAPEDIIVFSIHWGGNWGYQIPNSQRRFAHALIDKAGVDIIHGHSSHHVKGIEVYKQKLILYGCGDFITDYEGISGKEQFRDDLSFMYFPDIEPDTGNLINLTLIPTKIRQFRITDPTAAEIQWIKDVLNREGKQFGTSVTESKVGLNLHW